MNGKRGRAAASIAALLLLFAAGEASASASGGTGPRPLPELAARAPGVRLAVSLAHVFESGRSLLEGASGRWRAGLEPPRITAEQSLPGLPAAAGEVVTLRTVFENHGGRAGVARWVQEVPAGFEHLPQAGESAFDVDGRGRLVWAVEVPPRPGIAEREIRLRVADSALANRRGGLRTLFLRATVNGEALPVQTLDILCPDITVRVLAERAELAPGALCVMKLQITNRSATGAPLLLEADIPHGFAEASAALPTGARRAGRRLSWQVEAPPADASGPSVVEVAYPLRVEALPAGVQRRAVAHTAGYTVAGGAPQRAVSAKTVVSHPRPLALFSAEGVLIAVAGVLFLGTMAVFLLILLRKE
ncbi:MAG: hypothetical protein FWE77_05020 [Clostridia bacterium]|nr:hypothetical protein [Clostridia bacterium]